MTTLEQQSNEINENNSADDTVPLSTNSSFWEPKKIIKKRLPILQWLPKYTLTTLFQDILAGFTVGLTEIPQGIAFARIAELPPQYGLYCGFMGGFIYAIFGSCKDVNIGPTSIMALMIQPHVVKMGEDVAITITFIAGVLIFAFGLLHLGFVVRFFSYPIIAAFTCAASLQIGSSQLKGLFGLPGKADGFLDSWVSLFRDLDKVRLWDSVLGICSIIFLVCMKELGRFGSLQSRPEWSTVRNIIGRFIFMLSLARNALIVIIGTGIAYSVRDSKEKIFNITGKVEAGFPPFQPPPFSTNATGTDYDFNDIAKDYGVSLIFLPLVAILEAVAIAKAFTKGRPLDATQELIALGLCNIMGSFVRSMPVTGSFTRTAVNNASGVKTPLAGIFTSCMVLLAIAFLTSTFYYIPKATLASVVICAMFYLFEYEAFILLWRTKKLDLLLFLITLLCCLFISLEYGILIGIAINLLFILYTTARPKLNIIQEKITNYQGDVYMITPKDTLHFPAAEHLRNTILGINANAIVVVNGKYLGNIDFTVAKSLVELANELRSVNRKLIFIEFKQKIIDVCVGINGDIIEFFHDGNIEDIIRDEAIIEVPTVFTIQ